MTNTIGPITLNRVHGFSKNGRRYVVLGDMTSEVLYNQLEELCQDADVNTTIFRIPGGKSKVEDLSTDDLFTVYCTFEDPSLPDGWYLITGPVKRRESDVVIWFFEIPLFLIAESESQFGAGLTLKDLATMSNDWSL